MRKKKHHRIRNAVRASEVLSKIPLQPFTGDINDKRAVRHYLKGQPAHQNSEHIQADAIDQEAAALNQKALKL